MRKLNPPALILLVAGLAAAGSARADEIVFSDGNRLEVQEVREATFEQVTYKAPGGSVQRAEAERVTRVVRKGDRHLDYALRLLDGNEDPGKIAQYLEKAIKDGADWAKPYAQFFLAELYDQHDKNREAVVAYVKVADVDAKHFYAPLALNRAAEIYLRYNKAQDATTLLDRLASGQFGGYWREKGSFGKARLLLAGGKAADAQRTFSQLASSATSQELRRLASCAEGHAMVLQGKARDAQRKFETVLGDKDAGSDARGYAWRGMGDCLGESDPQAAMLAYLRSFLLYPENPEAGGAAKAAAELSRSKGMGAEQRLDAISRSPLRLDTYTGNEKSAELMRRCLQLVSSSLVYQLVPKLLPEAQGDEKPALEFVRADALKGMAQANNDPAKLAEYETMIKDLQKRYPNYGRAALGGIEVFQAARDRALLVINQAKDEADEAKRTDLLNEGRRLFESVLEPFKATIADLSKQVNALNEKEINEELDEAGQQQKQELEFKRDLAEFMLAESYLSYADTFDDKDERRKEVLNQALKGYDTYIAERGSFLQFLFYSFIGRGETLLALGQTDEAARQFEDLTVAEPPYEPETPEDKERMNSLIKDVVIRGYYGLTRALVAAGKGERAFQVSQEISKNKWAGGWEDHNMGILLKFERSKALAGAGRGAQGADELYEVIQKALRAPDTQKIPGLGMSREGAGAARALSELSDLTGGEVYAPEVQYYVGVGYFLRRKPALAVAAFKGVLTSATTPQEREEWVPKAVKQIGNLLFEQERYLEAALAYETVFSEFPRHPDAGEAVRFALSAAKRAVEQFGEDMANESTPMVGFYRQIEQKAVTADKTKGAQILMNQAADMQKNQQWEAAARKYLEVPSEIKDDKGEVTKVRFYPNAIANAGYCFFQAYKQSKQEAMLRQARESLRKAADLAKKEQDADAQSLACFYLGELENELEQPQQALAALAPFDAELSATARYLVRARYQQAMAHLRLNQIDQAEADFAKIKDLSSDPYYARFAYQLGRLLRTEASKRLDGAGADPAQARALTAKAGVYIQRWFAASDKESLRDAHYWWAGSVLFNGGLYRDAVALYEEGFKRFPRPALTREQESVEGNESYDTAEVQYGYALAALGQTDKAYDILTGLTNVAYVTDLEGRKLMRGTFKERSLKGNRWFIVVTVDGQDKSFFETDPPKGGNQEFQGVEGDAYRAGYAKSDERRISRTLMRSYLVVEGRARAAWALWEAKKDKGFLADQVTAASNELRYVLQGLSENYYQQLTSASQLEPQDLTLRRWQADLQYLQIKMAREAWREVVSDVGQMELLGKLKTAPAEIRTEIERLKREAEGK